MGRIVNEQDNSLDYKADAPNNSVARQVSILDDDGEWDDEALAAALDGPVPTKTAGESSGTASPIPSSVPTGTSFSFPKSASSSSAAPKADGSQAAEPVNPSRFGPGRKKKKKKYY